MSEHRSEKWDIIARALKGLKAKLHHGKENIDVPYIDDTDECVTSESSADGMSTPETGSPKESVDLTDGVETSTIIKDLSGTAESEATSVIDASPTVVRPQTATTSEGVATVQSEHRNNDRTTHLEQREDTLSWGLPEALKNNLVMALSVIYGVIIVVMGLVLPLSEIFASSDHPYFFEVFYLYLYAVSMSFLVYVYTYLLRKERLFNLSAARTNSRTLTRTLSRSSLRSRRSSSNSEKSTSPGCIGPVRPLVRYNSTLSTSSLRRRRRIAYNPEVSSHTGSFYLRVGVIGFGIGSMIHSGLTFGHYFEVSHYANHCSDAVQAIKPFALVCFTFVQMYFIFMNSKMCVHKYKTLARFGLMHMSCTNICVWLRSIVLETLLVMKVSKRDAFNAMVQAIEEVKESRDKDSHEIESSQGLTESHNAKLSENEMGFMTELSCNLDAMMGTVVENSSVYLYPCTIEYSLVCACVLYVTWSNVGEGGTASRADSCSDFSALDSEDDSDDQRGNNRMSVDCGRSSKGLFVGILLFVVAVVCVVCFYVLTGSTSHVTAGTLLGHICEEVILIVTFIATAIASFQMRKMYFSAQQKVGIDEILTLISISGLGLYGFWSIIAALFYLDTLHGRLTIITNMLMLVQAGSQATFTLVALRASARNNEQLRSRPGRECVTFLLICNFALWVIDTFQTQRLEHNETQVDFYGTTAWSIFSHISVPLGIYFRFHSTVTLSIIWKKAWKKKDTHHKKDTLQHHETKMHSHHHQETKMNSYHHQETKLHSNHHQETKTQSHHQQEPNTHVHH